jgi:DNA-binding XRE family transcriptional regulator
MITLTLEEAENVLDALKELNKISIGVKAICLPAEIDDAMETLRAKLSEPPCKTGSSCTNKCERCGEVDPAEIHTCTPMTVKDIQTSDKNADEFTKFMKLHRAINGLSQVMLAEKIGIATAAIGQWERNETSPRYQTIFKLAKVFNVPTTEIFTLLSKRKNAKKENRL